MSLSLAPARDKAGRSAPACAGAGAALLSHCVSAIRFRSLTQPTPAGTKLAESVIKAAGIALEQDKAETGAGGGGTLTIVPYVTVQEENVQGVFDGPFPWENSFGFFLAGMVGMNFSDPMR